MNKWVFVFVFVFGIIFFCMVGFSVISNGDNLLEIITGNVVLVGNETENVSVEILVENESFYVNESGNFSEVLGVNLAEGNLDNSTARMETSGSLTDDSEFLEANDSVDVLESESEIIVGLKDPSSKKFFGIMDKSDEEIEEGKEEIREEVLNDLRIEAKQELSSGGFTLDVKEGVLEDLESDERVAYVEPVRYFSVSLSEAIGIVNASDVWQMNISGQNLMGGGQTVCVIDTGINYSHVDLAGRNATKCNLDCVDKICVEDCGVTDLNGHGTHVAGIVAASGGVTGVAPEVSYIGLKVFPASSQSGATTTGIKNAIDWCVDNSETYNISVITMSLGTASPYLYDSYCDSDYPSFNASITDAYNKNISVTVSSGNGANVTHISSPACISTAIPVGDTYDADIGEISWGNPLTCSDDTTAVDQIVCHANRGSLLRLLAPGALINSTWYDGGYNVEGGTSMAAPMVAGAIAIMNQYSNLSNQSMVPSDIEDVFYDTGKVISELGTDYSRINIYDAVLFVDVVAPNITLVSPSDNNVNLSVNQSFVCNATDWQLANVTFRIWNSSALYRNETKNLSGTANETSFNVSDMPEETYGWNCLGVDVLGNSDYASENFTLTIGGVSTTLVSPVDENCTAIADTNFSCNVSSDASHVLSNVTFYLWNGTGDLNHSETKNISGLSNTSVFNFSFVEEGNYSWNCLGVNNGSNSSWGDSNFTIEFDIPPSVIIDGEVYDSGDTGGGSSSSGGSSSTTGPVNETSDGNVTNRTNESVANKTDEDVVDYFAHNEEVDNSEVVPPVSSVNLYLSAGAIIVIVIVIILIYINSKKLKRRKTKKKNGKGKKTKA